MYMVCRRMSALGVRRLCRKRKLALLGAQGDSMQWCNYRIWHLNTHPCFNIHMHTPYASTLLRTKDWHVCLQEEKQRSGVLPLPTHGLCMDGIGVLEQYRVLLREQISVPLCVCTAFVCMCVCGCLEPIHLCFAPGLSQPNTDSEAGCGYQPNPCFRHTVLSNKFKCCFNCTNSFNSARLYVGC